MQKMFYFLVKCCLITSMVHCSVASAITVMKWKTAYESDAVAFNASAKTLCFSANMSMRKDRSFWNAKGHLDLLNSDGVSFKIRTNNPDCIKYFTLYLRSDDGWYFAHFYPAIANRWLSVVLRKSQMKVAGSVHGWKNITGLRLAAWKGGDGMANIEVKEFKPLVASSRISILRPKKSGATTFKYAEIIADILSYYGINTRIVDDADLSTAILQDIKILVLPNNANLPDGKKEVIRAFIAGGGKVVGFFNIPSEVANLVGIKKGEFITPSKLQIKVAGLVMNKKMKGFPKTLMQGSWNFFNHKPQVGQGSVIANWCDLKGTNLHQPALITTKRAVWLNHVYLNEDTKSGKLFVLAMLAHFDDKLWQEAALYRIKFMAKNLGYGKFKDAVKVLWKESAKRSEVRKRLRRAIADYNKAVELYEKQQFLDSLAVSKQAKKTLYIVSYMLSEKKEDEFRGAWLKRDELSKSDWQQLAKQVADGGINALFPYVFNAKGDADLEHCCIACENNKIKCHPWIVCFKSKLLGNGVMQRDRYGVKKHGWLCPADPKNRACQLQMIKTIATKRGVSGIHLDYIRYPSKDFCHCNGCRKRFAKFANRKIDNWDVLVDDKELVNLWEAYRQHQITSFVCEVRKLLHDINPTLKLSCAVLNSECEAKMNFAQDWVAWCQKGYLDFVCPMDYVDSMAGFEQVLRRQMNKLNYHKVPCYPGIGVTTSNKMNAYNLIEQIKITRRVGCKGYIIFDLTPTVQAIHLPFLSIFNSAF